MTAKSFENYFLHFPELDREKNFFKFWEKAIAELKKIPISTDIKINNKKSSENFSVYNIQYHGYHKSPVYGELLVPRGRKKPNVIINIHDYNNKNKYRQDMLEKGIAYLFLTLRGHESLPARNENEIFSPGYMTEHILDINSFYVKAAYLDVFRSVDMLRLNSDLNCSKVGVIGKGFGAAAALFTAAFSERVGALVLDTPSFCYLNLNQNLSESHAANEINKYISLSKGKKKELKSNLSYFDIINFSDMINCPVLAVVGLKDQISPPECVFALFNRLQTEKTIEVYPDEGNSAGGSGQFKKSTIWIKKKIKN